MPDDPRKVDWNKIQGDWQQKHNPDRFSTKKLSEDVAALWPVLQKQAEFMNKLLTKRIMTRGFELDAEVICNLQGLLEDDLAPVQFEALVLSLWRIYDAAMYFAYLIETDSYSDYQQSDLDYCRKLFAINVDNNGCLEELDMWIKDFESDAKFAWIENDGHWNLLLHSLEEHYQIPQWLRNEVRNLTIYHMQFFRLFERRYVDYWTKTWFCIIGTVLTASDPDAKLRRVTYYPDP